MKVRAMASRILSQLRHDPRTLGLMMFAPILVLTLLYFVFGGSTTDIQIGVINAPQSYTENLYENNVTVHHFLSEEDAEQALEKGDIIATINFINNKSYIQIDGTNSTKTKAVLAAIESAKAAPSALRLDLKSDIEYVYGSSDLEMFDNFGSILIGFMIFFFVFLIAGISFLQERTTGTLEKLLSTPIKRWEIVLGYVLGFGIVTVIQSALITLYVVYVLKVVMIGSIWLILLTTLLTAMCALTLGILLSTAANNEFQMIQFIPVVVIPQIFFSGLFDLSAGWQTVGHFMPLYYVADALKQVMLRGAGIMDIAVDLAVITGCCIVFILINIQLLKKHRKI